MGRGLFMKAGSPAINTAGKMVAAQKDVLFEAEITDDSVQRCSLVLPTGLYKQIREIAKKRNTSFTEIVRRFIAVGLIVDSVQDDENSQIIFREETDKGVRERELILI
ncbi:MAG: hypothetical protein HQK88_12155 [Nitrospirae bacterium]|nr:hypothetical protein [Nitrospirota bacterium]MBF0521344.1 hypothetical protein [Nitrospirota bacterium]MBF0535729.1 hypothetical protein [Nitrospirota bacterium]MBF0617554.1 hypothetical protein [Nitrospirota bacterium]